MQTSLFGRIAICLALPMSGAVSTLAPQDRPQTPTSIAYRVPTIPNVLGKSVSDAIDSLRWTELRIVQRDSMTKSVGPGIVLKQRPEAGTPVSRARAETLFVSAARKSPKHGPSFLGALAEAVLSNIAHPTRSTDASVTPSVDTTAKVPIGDGDSAVVPGKMIQDRTRVPDLSGRTRPMVAAALRKSRLNAGDAVVDYSDDVPEGRVFRQHPPAGTEVIMGTNVMTWYSRGPHPRPPTILVPSVIGLSLKDADDSLRRVGLLRGHVDYIVRAGGEGNVLHQSPQEGDTVHLRDAIDLTIVNPPVQIVVPSVIGLSQKDASRKLREEGLAVGRVTLVVLTGRDTVIVSQKPGAKTVVDSGTLVDLVENRPAEVRRSVVPDLKGKSLAEAESALWRDSLLLGEVVRLGTASRDTVTDQRPKAGESVVINSKVHVALGRASAVASLNVPQVVNLTVDSARHILQDSGFTRFSISGDGDTLTSASIVESQDPVAGTLATPDATISMVARTIPPLPLVPRLVGLRREEAREAARLDSLIMIVTSERKKLRMDDRVVSQDPAFGAMRRPDNTIDVVVELPIIPPYLAAIIGLGVVGGSAAIVRAWRRWIKAHGVRLVPVTREASVPELLHDGHDTLVSAAFTLRFDSTADLPKVETTGESLVKSEESSNV